MGILSTVIAWMSEHKLATAGIAAGVGYVAVSKVASAAQQPGVLPGTTGARAVQGGGIVSPIKVIPPPVLINTTKTVLRVTTKDPMPDGSLNARATQDPNSPKIGYWPKDGLVELLSPDAGTGMVYVRGPGVGPLGEALLDGWGAKAYLQPAN